MMAKGAPRRAALTVEHRRRAFHLCYEGTAAAVLEACAAVGRRDAMRYVGAAHVRGAWVRSCGGGEPWGGESKAQKPVSRQFLAQSAADRAVHRLNSQNPCITPGVNRRNDQEVRYAQRGISPYHGPSCDIDGCRSGRQRGVAPRVPWRGPRRGADVGIRAVPSVRRPDPRSSSMELLRDRFQPSSASLSRPPCRSQAAKRRVHESHLPSKFGADSGPPRVTTTPNAPCGRFTEACTPPQPFSSS